MSPVTDPIGDLLTRVRNAQRARRGSCRAPWSRLLQELMELLKRDQWIADVQVLEADGGKELEVTFHPGKSLTLQRISKPGRRVYSSSKEIRPVLHGFGVAIITTSQGLLTDREAREKGVGGEILCSIA